MVDGVTAFVPVGFCPGFCSKNYFPNGSKSFRIKAVFTHNLGESCKSLAKGRTQGPQTKTRGMPESQGFSCLGQSRGPPDDRGGAL